VKCEAFTGSLIRGVGVGAYHGEEQCRAAAEAWQDTCMLATGSTKQWVCGAAARRANVGEILYLWGAGVQNGPAWGIGFPWPS
jgi:hypothetical protein